MVLIFLFLEIETRPYQKMKGLKGALTSEGQSERKEEGKSNARLASSTKVCTVHINIYWLREKWV